MEQMKDMVAQDLRDAIQSAAEELYRRTVDADMAIDALRDENVAVEETAGWREYARLSAAMHMFREDVGRMGVWPDGTVLPDLATVGEEFRRLRAEVLRLENERDERAEASMANYARVLAVVGGSAEDTPAGRGTLVGRLEEHVAELTRALGVEPISEDDHVPSLVELVVHAHRMADAWRKVNAGEAFLTAMQEGVPELAFMDSRDPWNEVLNYVTEVRRQRDRLAENLTEQAAMLNVAFQAKNQILGALYAGEENPPDFTMATFGRVVTDRLSAMQSAAQEIRRLDQWSTAELFGELLRRSQGGVYFPLAAGGGVVEQRVHVGDTPDVQR